ncbi:MAG TPA: cysteine desulfurase family protein [Candidatus Gracilibacteria bacterium]|nr:cysteine desulfurase family protein [Candidatus Gracilibacteria bacterium]
MVYLDYAAATPLDPEVLKMMMPYLQDQYGNPSSIHQKGREARAAIEESRTTIADFFGCTPKEVIFTSGGTESNNWAVFGLAETLKGRGNHIITTAIEHDSVLKPMEQLQDRGFEVTFLQPDKDGIINPQQVAEALTTKTIFASIIYANNEIGTIQDIPQIAKILHKKNILLHTDACQAVNEIPTKMVDVGADLMTINSGKIYGPKGAGALLIKENTNITPLLFGGGQEFRMRAGTENVAALVGFASAIKKIQPEPLKTIRLRDHFIEQLLKIEGVTLNGHPKMRLPNNINVSVEGINNESLLVRLDMEGIAASAGSACSSGSIEPSHVLLALGQTKEQAATSIRFSLGKDTTKEQIDKTVEKFAQIIYDLRGTKSEQTDKQ